MNNESLKNDCLYKEYIVRVYRDSTEWFFNGKRHRLDGSALEGLDDYKSWYFYGQRLTEERWKQKTQGIRRKQKEVKDDC